MSKSDFAESNDYSSTWFSQFASNQFKHLIPPAYLDRIREYVSDLDAAALRVNSDGLVNDVVIVNDDLVFRFPKNDRARQALAQETRILDLVRRYVDMPLPVFGSLGIAVM